MANQTAAVKISPNRSSLKDITGLIRICTQTIELSMICSHPIALHTSASFQEDNGNFEFSSSITHDKFKRFFVDLIRRDSEFLLP